ncbi:Methyl-accepting chemotaxis protein McpA [Sulfitobacter noctilucicola]|nr:Methyl-accepting chemotaxis protein McpA [Sulfitobacter noctilucicola]
MVAVCVLLVVAVILFVEFQQNLKKAEDVIEMRGSEVTQLLAGQMGGSIKFSNKEAIELIISDAMKVGGEELVTATVFDAQGSVIYSTQPDVSGEVQSLAKRSIQEVGGFTGSDGLSFAVASRFGANNEVVGAVSTVWTLEPSVASILQNQGAAMLLGFAVFAVAIIGAGISLRAQMSQPLIKLQTAMQNVAHEDYETDVPFTKRRDEIGQMARILDAFRLALSEANASRAAALFAGAGFEGSSAAMMVVDKDARVVFANPACEEIIRALSPEIRTFWPSADEETLVGADLSSAEKLQPLLKAAIDNPSKNLSDGMTKVRIGEKVVAINVDAALDRDGQLLGCVIEWTDRTEAEKHAALIQAIDVGQAIVEFSLEGKIIAANQNFLGMIGGTFEDTIKCSITSMFAHNLDGDTDGRAFARAAFAGEVPAGQFKAFSVHADKTFILDGNFGVVHDTNGEPESAIFIGNDVTKRSEMAELAEAERTSVQREQNKVVEILTVALKKLSDGDLESDIRHDVPESYVKLRDDFNGTVASLRETISKVIHNSDSIRNETSEITSAADDLSRRTEKQAATLEETAAALDELTVSVRSAAEGADEASRTSADAQSNAEQGGEVARKAVVAMDGIKTSSQEISKITSVIDDIAFQTNLLALNAGVEAARAGEAGRGFAVVATEVRGLAQRSSDAAREINALITSSGEQVQQGVDLVGKTGTALASIVTSISEISKRVANIASSSREQAVGLAEINTAMNELDHVTQQNAAMFEETTAASHALTSEADALVSAVAGFKIGEGKRQVHKPVKPAAVPASAPRTSHVVQGNTALAPVHDADGWEEF